MRKFYDSYMTKPTEMNIYKNIKNQIFNKKQSYFDEVLLCNMTVNMTFFRNHQTFKLIFNPAFYDIKLSAKTSTRSAFCLIIWPASYQPAQEIFV